MPPLLRFMLSHAAIGFALAFVFVGALLGADVSGLRTLLLASDIGWLALALLTFFSGLTFASVQMGLAVMMFGEDDDDDVGGKGRRWRHRIGHALLDFLAPPRPHRALAPVPVRHK